MSLQRLNNSESCICCARRSDGLAVGARGRLGWYCLECGPALAWKAIYMVPANMDKVEQMAVEKVACLALEDNDPFTDKSITIQGNELPAFIAWCVKQFALAMREQFDGKS